MSKVPERRRSRRVYYRGRVLDLWVDQVSLPNRKGTFVREVVGHRPGVAVVPVLPDGRILLVDQYRYAVRRRVWEIPAGLLEARERPLDGARRELLEETGYQAATWQPLGEVYSSPGFCEEKVHLYLATGLTRQGRPRPDRDELVRVKTFTATQLGRWLDQRRIQDSKTVAGLCLAWRKLSRD